MNLIYYYFYKQGKTQELCESLFERNRNFLKKHLRNEYSLYADRYYFNHCVKTLPLKREWLNFFTIQCNICRKCDFCWAQVLLDKKRMIESDSNPPKFLERKSLPKFLQG